ncbi:MAG: YybH family protein, partial [Acidiferrobacterales bacterium]
TQKSESKILVQPSSSPSSTIKLSSVTTLESATPPSGKKSEKQVSAKKPTSTSKVAEPSSSPSSKDTRATTSTALASTTVTSDVKAKKQSPPKEQQSEQKVLLQPQKKEQIPSDGASKPKEIVAHAAPSEERASSLQDDTRDDRSDSLQTLPGTKKPEKAVSTSDREDSLQTSPSKEKSDAIMVAKPEASVPKRITTDALSGLLRKFVSDYESGNLDQFMSLFAEDAQTNQRRNRGEIRKDYDDLFQKTDLRRMKVKDVNWKLGGGAAHGWGRFEVKIRTKGQSEVKIYVGKLTFQVKKQGQRVSITRLQHSQTKLKAKVQ